MIIPEDKRRIATIIGKKKAGASAPAVPMKNEIVKKEDGKLDGKHVAAQDILSALHEKSPEKLMHALSNFHDLHVADGEKSEA